MERALADTATRGRVRSRGPRTTRSDAFYVRGVDAIRVTSSAGSLGPLFPPAALRVGAEVEEEAEDDDEPLEAVDPVGAGAPHHRVGERRPGEQEEAEQRHDPAVEGAA